MTLFINILCLCVLSFFLVSGIKALKEDWIKSKETNHYRFWRFTIKK